MLTGILPATYEEWRYCITVMCKLALTHDYVTQRIASLSEENSAETQSFRRLYGDAHWRSVLGWFERARNEIN